MSSSFGAFAKYLPARSSRGSARRAMGAIFVASAVFAAFSLAMTGCRKSGDGDSGGKTVLRLWVMPNTSRPQGDLDAILKRFEDDNPDIDVSVEILDWGPAWTKITLSLIHISEPTRPY